MLIRISSEGQTIANFDFDHGASVWVYKRSRKIQIKFLYMCTVLYATMPFLALFRVDVAEKVGMAPKCFRTLLLPPSF